MPDWLQIFIPDGKSIVELILGAIIGAIIARLFESKLRSELKKEREEARHDREAAIQGREGAVRDREMALGQLAKREAEIDMWRLKLQEQERLLNVQANELNHQKTKTQKLLEALRSTETVLWTTFSKQPPYSDFDLRIARQKPLIITVANLKGGVGKTTLTGNLAAYFNQKLKKRVLIIDLDYQGSLSIMLGQGQGDAKERTSHVNALLMKDADLGAILTSARPLGHELYKTELIPAFYELALLEDRLMVEWLLQEGGDDVRYRLAKLLLQDAIADRFDLILIDLPPRMTTGAINALCASTHVLVPTIFNPLSAEPVENFLKTARTLMDFLNPKLSFLGVLETMSPPSNQGKDARAEGRTIIVEALKKSFPDVHIFKSNVPRRTAIANGTVAYLQNDDAKAIFNAVGDEIRGRIGL